MAKATVAFGGIARVKAASAISVGDYVAHLEALRTAVENSEKLKFLFRAAEIKVEAWRTECANVRNIR